MLSVDISIDVEQAAERVHQAYLDTATRLGWPIKPSNNVPYAELSEESKELDRASAKAVLGYVQEVLEDGV